MRDGDRELGSGAVSLLIERLILQQQPILVVLLLWFPADQQLRFDIELGLSDKLLLFKRTSLGTCLLQVALTDKHMLFLIMDELAHRTATLATPRALALLTTSHQFRLKCRIFLRQTFVDNVICLFENDGLIADNLLLIRAWLVIRRD